MGRIPCCVVFYNNARALHKPFTFTDLFTILPRPHMSCSKHPKPASNGYFYLPITDWVGGLSCKTAECTHLLAGYYFSSWARSDNVGTAVLM